MNPIAADRVRRQMSEISERARFALDHRWAPEQMSDYLDGELARPRGRRGWSATSASAPSAGGCSPACGDARRAAAASPRQAALPTRPDRGRGARAPGPAAASGLNRLVAHAGQTDHEQQHSHSQPDRPPARREDRRRVARAADPGPVRCAARQGNRAAVHRPVRRREARRHLPLCRVRRGAVLLGDEVRLGDRLAELHRARRPGQRRPPRRLQLRHASGRGQLRGLRRTPRPRVPGWPGRDRASATASTPARWSSTSTRRLAAFGGRSPFARAPAGEAV